jgi:predicted RNA-binding protein (virulence factor B family)
MLAIVRFKCNLILFFYHPCINIYLYSSKIWKMVEIGKLNTLKIVKRVDFGLYLDGEESGEILLPLRYVPENAEVDELIEVFIYLDSEDRIIATTIKPLAMVDEFVYLKVVSVNSVGAFLDWGLMKDLLVPFREQQQTMEEGKSYVVFVYLDKDSRRIVASAKLDKFLDNVPPVYKTGEEVDLLIVSQTDLGYNAIVNNTHWGILYKNEVFQNLPKGKKMKGYIKKVREDDKIDLTSEKPGYERIDGVSAMILNKLVENNGFLNLSDKTDPEYIYLRLGISKKAFKMGIGALYKARKVRIAEEGIYLINSQNEN